MMILMLLINGALVIGGVFVMFMMLAQDRE